MDNKIKGRLTAVLPLQTGQGRNGEWKKQEFILETDDRFPRKICIAVWGDKVNLASFAHGSVLEASVDIESREFNGKWYTSVTAWKVELAGSEPQQATTPLPPLETYGNEADMPPMKDDLPF